MSIRSQLRKRLSGYWKMEVGNVLLLPAVMVFMTMWVESQLGWLSYVTIVPMCGLLLIGGLYWRGKLKQLDGEDGPLWFVMRIADQWKIPLGLGSFLALLLAIAGWAFPDLSVSLADRVAATIAATLAVLEYINYYHRQLQHFDHPADFKRLMTGGGFRKSQMAVDLRRYRNKSG